MPELKEYDFRFPEFEPAPRGLRHKMDVYLAQEKTKGNFSYEKQRKTNATFRSTDFLHLDSSFFLKRLGNRTLQLCTTSTPTIFVDGKIGIDPIMHKKALHGYTVPQTVIDNLGTHFGDTRWLDTFIESGGDTSQYPGVYITRDFFSTQAQPYELATGSIFTMLHKSAERKPEDPSARVLYRRYSGYF